MALYNSLLKKNVFITIDEVADWLDIKPEKINVPPGEIKASKVIEDILYTSKLNGTLGNDISIEYIDGPTLSVSVLDKKITVQIINNVSTTKQIRDEISLSGQASTLVFCEIKVVEPDTLIEVENRTQYIIDGTFLVNGANDVPFSSLDDENVEQRRRILERLINVSCEKVESIIETNVLAKQFQEEFDANNSDVIVPSKFPIISIDEMRIDYNRDFNADSIIENINYVLRGSADIRQSNTNKMRIKGSDICMVDYDSVNIIGRVFAGSSVACTRIKYTAGYGIDIDDVPSDLKQAAILLVEFYEFKRSNRDLGIQSKGVRGESYTKIKDGIPETILELLEQYIDRTFGIDSKNQSNFFGV